MRLLFVIIMSLVFAAGAYAQSEQEQLAAQYLRNQEFEKARDLYEELYREDPSVYYYNYLMECLIALEDYREARRLARERQEISDVPRRYDVELGYIYSLEGQDRRARRQYRNAIRDLPATRQDYIDLANAFMSRNLAQYAIEVLERGNQRITSGRAFHMELATVYASVGKYEEMMGQYIAILEKVPDYSRDIRDELQLFIEDGDQNKLNAVRTGLLEASRARSSDPLFAELLVWFSTQMKDFHMALVQAKALDRRLNEKGDRVYELAKIIADNQRYGLAAEAYEYVLEKGRDAPLFLSSKVRLLDVRFEELTSTGKFAMEKMVALEKQYMDALEELGFSARTIELMMNLAHMQAFYMNKPQQAQKLLEEAVSMPRARPQQVARAKIALADVLVMDGQVWEATLLYQQVEKDFKEEPLGHKAKLKNAQLSFYMGEFQWALTQLDVLRAATSKLIANDAMMLALLIRDNVDMDQSEMAIQTYARADLYAFQRKPDKALKVLDSLVRFFPGHVIQDQVLFRKAELYMQKEAYHKADSLFARIVERHGREFLADDALMEQARLNEFYLNRPEKAKELYMKLITDYPGSLYTVEARRRFRVLRGDGTRKTTTSSNLIN